MTFRRLSLLIFSLSVSLACFAPVSGQGIPVGDLSDRYLRFLQLNGTLRPFSLESRPLSWRVYTDTLTADGRVHPWQGQNQVWKPHRVGPMVYRGRAFTNVHLNTARPSGSNDGFLWRGQGVTYEARAQVEGRIGPLSFSVAPGFSFNQNGSFDTTAMVVRDFDNPQRPYHDAFTTFDAGNTGIALGVGGVAVGISNQNLWFGPGRSNAIMLSNNAPGFWHAYAGTDRPFNAFIGHFQLKWLWGRLNRSENYASTRERKERLITAAVVQFSPRFPDGLSVGITRAYHMYRPENFTTDDLFMLFHSFAMSEEVEAAGGVDAFDQMATLFMRWVFPESGFEFYGELGKGDWNQNMRELKTDPEHGSGYTLGASKVLSPRGSGTMWEFNTEFTTLQSTRTSYQRPRPYGLGQFFYVHGIVREGYTQRGQILGAGIGSGSSSLSLGLDGYSERGLHRVFARRLVRHADRYLARESNKVLERLETELSLGAEANLFLEPFELRVGGTWAYTLNEYFVYKNDHANLSLTVGIGRRF